MKLREPTIGTSTNFCEKLFELNGSFPLGRGSSLRIPAHFLTQKALVRLRLSAWFWVEAVAQSLSDHGSSMFPSDSVLAQRE